MPSFAYSARDAAGRDVAGTIEAPSRRDALRLLAARGLQVAAVNETGAAPAAAARAAAPAVLHAVPLTRKQRLPFLEALHDLVTSGMSAGLSLGVVYSPSPVFLQGWLNGTAAHL